MTSVRAEDLTYTEVQSLDMSRTICFQPVSALEVHGPHLPLGMDFFMARWMAEETGRRFAEAHPDWTVVQLPPLPLGTDELPLAGSMNASQRTVYRALLAHGASLARAGYRYAVLTNGHGGPRHAAAIEAACRRVSKRHRINMFSPSILALHRIITGQRFETVEAMLGRPLTENERRGLLAGEHAGSWETSFRPLATLGDRLVRWRGRHGHETTKLQQTVQTLSNGIGWLLNAKYGYGGPVVCYQGDPSVASAEVGTAFREIMVQECLDIVQGVTAGRVSAGDVRSIASDHAIVQPNFWPRVGLAIALVVLLLLMF